MKAASRLQLVCDNWTTGDLHAALTYNRRLWTILASSATAEENPLPLQIKQNIANLALFVFNRTINIETDPAPSKLSPLISINREIAAGLRGE